MATTFNNNPASVAVPSFSPTKINLFRQCPERYLRRYHGGRYREPITRPLAIGKGVHALMEVHARQAQHGWTLTEAAVVSALKAAGYPDGEGSSFDDDAETVLRSTKWGIEEFDSRYSNATVLVTEGFLDYLHGQADTPLFRLEAKLDLVVLHGDGGLEHVDYKTGKFEIDKTQNLISRIVAGKSGKQLAAGRPFTGQHGVRTTVIFLGEQQTHSAVMSREELLTPWTELQTTIGEMMAGIANLEAGTAPWLPKPNGLCAYCPFQATCTKNRLSSDDEEMQDWLDGSHSLN